jgi:hypothetical protein
MKMNKVDACAKWTIMLALRERLAGSKNLKMSYYKRIVEGRQKTK